MDRRDFLFQTVLASAGLTLTPAELTLAARNPQRPAWTAPSHAATTSALAGLAPRVALADAFHLAAADTAAPVDVRAALAKYDQLALNADAVEATPAEVVGLLKELKALWPDRDDEPDKRQGVRGDMAEQRLAWAAGRLASDAAAHALGRPSAEAVHARDGLLLRTLREATPASPTGPAPNDAALADLFRLVRQRTAIRLHTYQPDPEDAGGWIVRLVEWSRARDAEADRLAGAVLDADPNLAFLDASDPAFRLARAARQAHPVPPAALDRAAEAPGGSAYARAVGGAFSTVRAVGRFFGGTLAAGDLLAFVTRS